MSIVIEGYEDLLNDIKTIKTAIKSGKAKNLIGIYMEGPYLNVNFGAGRVNHPWAPTVAKERFYKIVDEAYEVTKLAKEAGVTMTGAGATFPSGKDPADSNIRVAPSLPPVEELEKAMEIFCASLKMAALEQMGV